MGVHGSSVNPYDAIYGELDPADNYFGPDIVVNPSESPPTGIGAPNVQQFQTGHLNNQKVDYSLFQGVGVGPERQWPHYPHAENPNMFRRTQVMQRDGTDSYSDMIWRGEESPIWLEAIAHEQLAERTRERSPVNPIVEQTPSLTFTESIAGTPGGY